MFVLRRCVPVCEEDKSGPQPGPKVLGQDVVYEGDDGELPHHGQGEAHSGVEMSS